MTLRVKILLSVLAIVAAVAVGRFTAPEKVKIEKVVVEVEKKTKDTHKETKTVEKTNPDGSKSTETTIVEDTKEKEYSKSKESDKKEVTSSKTRVRISALAGYNVNRLSISQSPSFGSIVSVPILGPIDASAFGLSSGLVGIGIGLSF